MLPEPNSELDSRLARPIALSNSHGQIAMNSAAPTVRTRPSSAENPESPPPANPASQYRITDIVATAPSTPPQIAATVCSSCAT